MNTQAFLLVLLTTPMVFGFSFRDSDLSKREIKSATQQALILWLGTNQVVIEDINYIGTRKFDIIGQAVNLKNYKAPDTPFHNESYIVEFSIENSFYKCHLNDFYLYQKLILTNCNTSKRFKWRGGKQEGEVDGFFPNKARWEEKILSESDRMFFSKRTLWGKEYTWLSLSSPDLISLKSGDFWIFDHSGFHGIDSFSLEAKESPAIDVNGSEGVFFIKPREVVAPAESSSSLYNFFDCMTFSSQVSSDRARNVFLQQCYNAFKPLNYIQCFALSRRLPLGQNRDNALSSCIKDSVSESTFGFIDCISLAKRVTSDPKRDGLMKHCYDSFKPLNHSQCYLISQRVSYGLNRDNMLSSCISDSAPEGLLSLGECVSLAQKASTSLRKIERIWDCQNHFSQ